MRNVQKTHKSKLKSADKRSKFQLLRTFLCRSSRYRRLLDDDHTAHGWVRGTVVGKASRSFRREDETSALGHFWRTPCRGIRGRRVREGVLVEPLYGVARGDRELRRHEGEFANSNYCRGAARGRRGIVTSGRLHARRDARRDYNADRQAPRIHFFARTFARTCSACARCAATAGLTCVISSLSSAARARGDITLSIDARNFRW